MKTNIVKGVKEFYQSQDRVELFLLSVIAYGVVAAIYCVATVESWHEQQWQTITTQTVGCKTAPDATVTCVTTYMTEYKKVSPQ